MRSEGKSFLSGSIHNNDLVSTKYSQIQIFNTLTNSPWIVILPQGIWMLISLLVLFFFNLLSAENYFIISFIGLLIVLHVYAPRINSKAWWPIVRLITLAGYFIFAWIMYQRISDVAVLI